MHRHCCQVTKQVSNFSSLHLQNWVIYIISCTSHKKIATYMKVVQYIKIGEENKKLLKINWNLNIQLDSIQITIAPKCGGLVKTSFSKGMNQLSREIIETKKWRWFWSEITKPIQRKFRWRISNKDFQFKKQRLQNQTVTRYKSKPYYYQLLAGACQKHV